LTRHDRGRLKRLVADRNTPVKVVWRARIVLATAEGLGTNAIMRRTGKSKPCVWRWQERYIAEGVDGLLRDKMRPPGKKPLLHDIALKAPKSAPQWSMRSMGKDACAILSDVLCAKVGIKLEYHRPIQENPGTRGGNVQ